MFLARIFFLFLNQDLIRKVVLLFGMRKIGQKMGKSLISKSQHIKFNGIQTFKGFIAYMIVVL